MDHKIIYLARRNPALSAQQFAQAWREHAQFAATFGDQFRRYFKGSSQCVKLWDAQLPPSFANDYDGATLLTMVDREGLLAARYQPGTVDALRKDEERVFAAHVDDWTMNAEEYLLAGERKGDAAILSFLYPKVGETPAFWAASRAGAEALAALPALSGASRIAWNKVVDPSVRYGFGALIEIWFPSADQAERAANDGALVAALEQADIANPSSGARLLTRLNAKAAG